VIKVSYRLLLFPTLLAIFDEEDGYETAAQQLRKRK
jgi:hypothetical protein